MNAVIYARYSPGPRQTDQSIEGQVRDCKTYAKEHNITILDIYADKHISGSDFENRAAFNRMLHDAEKQQFDAIIVGLEFFNLLLFISLYNLHSTLFINENINIPLFSNKFYNVTLDYI